MFKIYENPRASLWYYKGEFWVVPSGPEAPFTLPARRPNLATTDSRFLSTARCEQKRVALLAFATRYGPGAETPCPVFHVSA